MIHFETEVRRIPMRFIYCRRCPRTGSGVLVLRNMARLPAFGDRRANRVIDAARRERAPVSSLQS